MLKRFVSWMVSLDSMLYWSRPSCRALRRALNQWDTYDFCGVADTFLVFWNLFLDRLEKQPSHATVTGNQTGGGDGEGGGGYIWKSLLDPIVCLILSFFLFLSPFCASCHLQGCVSSVVLANWCRHPSSSCCGDGDYFNPTPPAHFTIIIIIIISPKRSIARTDAAVAVSNAPI